MATYDTIGRGYASFRVQDARISAAINAALGDARSVVNVGAGTGSYEPDDREVVAIEPSETMIRQRPSRSAPCLQGTADALPVETKSVDAGMAILTMHHWADLERGLKELARVVRRRVVLLTWVPDSEPFWLTRDYFPQILAHDIAIFPASCDLVASAEVLIVRAEVIPLPVPHDCTDGFLGAYWRRPELYLDDDRRSAISSFTKIDAARGLAALQGDLSSGRWAEQNRTLLDCDVLDVGYRLLCCDVTHA